MHARALRNCRLARRLPFGMSVTMSRDGNVIGGFERDQTLAFYRTTGERIARHPWSLGAPHVVLGEDGTWFAAFTDEGIEKRDVVTGGRIALATGNFSGALQYHDGELWSRDHAWRAEDLAPIEIPAIPPRNARRCGARFAASAIGRGSPGDVTLISHVVLWDRVRGRSVLRHACNAYTFDVATPGGRFAVLGGATDLVALDLVTLVERGRFAVEMPPDPRMTLSCDGRVAIISNLSYSSLLYELDWDFDPAGDPDPLVARWGDDERPPIVGELEAVLDQRPDDLVLLPPLARNHPSLEVKVARWLAPMERIEWTRRALDDPRFARQPDVWLQLADAAIACGELDIAADAAAEGLGREDDHPALLAVLERVLGLRARRAGTARRWTAHGAPVVEVAVVGDRVITCGRDRIRWWDLATGERLYSYNTASPVLCLDAGYGRVVAGTHARGVFLFDLASTKRIARVEGSETWNPVIIDPQNIPPPPPPRPVTAIAIGEHDIISADRFIRWWSPSLEEVSLALAGYDHEPVTALRFWNGGALGLSLGRLRRYGRRGEPLAFAHPIVGHRAQTFARRGDELYMGGEFGMLRGYASALDGLAGNVVAIACGHLTAAVDDVGNVAWWRAGAPVAVGHHRGATCVATAGEIVVSGASDGSVVVWE